MAKCQPGCILKPSLGSFFVGPGRVCVYIYVYVYINIYYIILYIYEVRIGSNWLQPEILNKVVLLHTDHPMVYHGLSWFIIKLPMVYHGLSEHFMTLAILGGILNV